MIYESLIWHCFEREWRGAIDHERDGIWAFPRWAGSVPVRRCATPHTGLRWIVDKSPCRPCEPCRLGKPSRL